MPPEGRPLVLHVFPGFGIGGAQMRFCQVANHWGDAFRHRIVSLNGATECAARLDPALDVQFLPAGLTKGDMPGNLRRIRAALRQWQPDVLVTSNWGSMEWALALLPPGGWRPRHIHTEDGFGPEERERQLPRRCLTRRLALRRATTAVPSRTLQRIALEQWHLPPARLHLVPNGVALDASPLPAPPWPEPPGLVVGTVATLRAEKNLGRLIRAFAAVPPPARLVIVGEGSERRALEAMAAQPGLAGRVIFTGYQPQPARLAHHFDLFALSSDTEQMPLSVLEAMAAGRPVATTDVGDVRAMLAAENADQVVARDDDALAAALVQLCADPALRTRIGHANRALAVRDFSLTVMCERHGALWLGRHEKGRP